MPILHHILWCILHIDDVYYYYMTLLRYLTGKSMSLAFKGVANLAGVLKGSFFELSNTLTSTHMTIDSDNPTVLGSPTPLLYNPIINQQTSASKVHDDNLRSFLQVHSSYGSSIFSLLSCLFRAASVSALA